MTAFEDGLWERLVKEHDADLVSITAPREQSDRRPLVIGGSVTALAAVTAAVVLGITAATTAPPAYAMTQNTDGSVTVTINDLATAIPELNAKFADMGIQETVVPITANCTTKTLVVDAKGTMSDTVTLAPGGKWLPPGDAGVLAAEQLANGRIATFIGTVKPPVPSCFSAARVLEVTGRTTANGTPIITTTTVTPANAK